MISIAKAQNPPPTSTPNPSQPSQPSSSSSSTPPATPEILPEQRAETQQLLYDSFMDRFEATQMYLPRFAVKINLLYGAGTLTPNIGAAFALGERSTLELLGSYNPWHLKGNFESNRKLVHMILRADYRYWLCERYNGHFFSIGPVFVRYNAGGYNIPLLFEKAYRYDGTAWGGGVGYGYQWMLGRRWGLEANISLGVMLFDYDRYSCVLCDREAKPDRKVYYGLTDAGVTIVFLIK